MSNELVPEKGNDNGQATLTAPFNKNEYKQNLQYPILDDKQDVICQLCGKPFKFISGKHLQKFHSISSAEYKLKFPNVTMASPKKEAARKARNYELFKKELELSSKEINYCNTIVENDHKDLVNIIGTIQKDLSDTQKISTDLLQKPNVDMDESITDDEVEKITDSVEFEKPVIIDEIDKLESIKVIKLENIKAPLVEELDVSKESDTLFKLDNNIRPDISLNKFNLLKQLKIDFPRLKTDYFIESYALNGSLVFRFITDMCDPAQKIDFEFPSAYWHNTDSFDPHRNKKLTDDGWKVIVVKSKSPSYSDVIKELKLLEKSEQNKNGIS